MRFADVGLWHKADMLNALTNVRFWGRNGHGAGVIPFPLMTQRGPGLPIFAIRRLLSAHAGFTHNAPTNVRYQG